MAGNLPYFAASFITRRALENPRPPRSMVVMVQREVAREFAARAGKLSLLALAIQVYAEPAVLFDVAPEAFEPPPAVWSSVVRLAVRESSLVPRAAAAEARRLLAEPAPTLEDEQHGGEEPEPEP